VTQHFYEDRIFAVCHWVLGNRVRIQPYTMDWDFIYCAVFTSHEKISFGDLDIFRFNEFQFFHSEPKSTTTPTNKKPRYWAGLDVVKRVNLFQQYHLLGLPELTCLNSVNVHSCRYTFTHVTGTIPAN